MNMIEQINLLKEKSTLKAPISIESEGFNLITLIYERNNNFSSPFEFKLPVDLEQWWTKIESAELFKDVEFGQWGLKIMSDIEAVLSTKNCLAERPSEFRETDLVIGSFFGDSDLLIVSCDEKSFGNIIVALPIDKRPDWYYISPTFSDFLTKYIEEKGNKFWE